MRKRFLAAFISLLFIVFLASDITAVDFRKGSADDYFENDLSVVVRLMGGRGSVLNSGRELRLTLRANKDAYVIVYNIDSEGFVNLLFPSDGRPRKLEADKVYTLPERGSGLRFEVGDKTGVEYIHAIAVPERNMIDEQELYFLSETSRNSPEKRFRTDMDPYLSFNTIDENVIEGIDRIPVATDHTYFFANRRVDYPGYLCSKCHGSDKISDPYGEQCPEIAIERNYYDTALDYPYPPLYNIAHVSEKVYDDKNYYSSTSYYDDNLSNDWDDELISTDDTDIYLSINYWDHGYYPRYSYLFPRYSYYYPYYGYSYWYPSYYYTHSSYWGFGVSWGYWDYYDWYWYGGYHYPGWYAWSYPHHWWRHNHYWDSRHYAGRSIYSGRSFRRRNLDFHTTLDRTRKTRSLRGSRLYDRRSAYSDRRLRDSRLARASTTRGITSRRTSAQSRRVEAGTRYSPRTRIIYGRSERSSRTRATGSSRVVERRNYPSRSGNRSSTVNSRTRYSRENRSTDSRARSSRSYRETRSSGSDRSSRTRRERSDDSGNKSTRQSSSSRSSRKSSSVRKSSGSRGSSSSSGRSRSGGGSSRSRSSGSSSKSSRGSGRSRGRR